MFFIKRMIILVNNVHTLILKNNENENTYVLIFIAKYYVLINSKYAYCSNKIAD